MSVPIWPRRRVHSSFALPSLFSIYSSLSLLLLDLISLIPAFLVSPPLNSLSHGLPGFNSLVSDAMVILSFWPLTDLASASPLRLTATIVAILSLISLISSYLVPSLFVALSI